MDELFETAGKQNSNNTILSILATKQSSNLIRYCKENKTRLDYLLENQVRGGFGEKPEKVSPARDLALSDYLTRIAFQSNTYMALAIASKN